jgi:purine-binding chemotaxis protein CheW
MVDPRDDSATQRVLEERAQALARPQTHTDETPGEELVVFQLGDASYGLSARSVQEVYPLNNFTPLPGTPDFVVGLVNVRGRLLSALDIRPLLDLPKAAPQANSLLLIVSTKAMEVALIADAVLDVRRTVGNPAPTLSSMAGHGTAWLHGIDHHSTLLIDPALLLADPRLIVNTAA